MSPVLQVLVSGLDDLSAVSAAAWQETPLRIYHAVRLWLWLEETLVKFVGGQRDNPLVLSLVVSVAAALFCFLISIPSRNVSWVDRLWSITPVVYAWLYSREEWTRVVGLATEGKGGGGGGGGGLRDLLNVRLLSVSGLIAIWGLRLSFNFYRKGGYNLWKNEEDYRWNYVRRFPGLNTTVGWLLFNIVFISLYQHLLLWSLTLPLFYIHRFPSSWTDIDTVACASFAILLMVEVVADQQQWSFYARRAKFRSSKGGSKSDQGVDPDLVNGFNTQGLFRFCRHPNFFAEQGLWVCVWVFSLATQHSSLSALTGSLQTWAEQVWETRDFALALETLFSKEILNESWIGAVLLILLFMGSLGLTEDISISKYPAYKSYQKTTSALIPWIPGPYIKVHLPAAAETKKKK